MKLKINTPRWMMPILISPSARYFGAYAGRGSGKSHGFAEMLIERSVTSKVDAVCVR
jgi:phage terminase large subunit